MKRRRRIARGLLALNTTLGAILLLSSCGGGGGDDTQISYRSLTGEANSPTLASYEDRIPCVNCVDKAVLILDKAELDASTQPRFQVNTSAVGYLPNESGFFSANSVVHLRVLMSLENTFRVTKLMESETGITVLTQICDRPLTYGLGGVMGVWLVIPKTQKPVQAPPPEIKTVTFTNPC